MTGSVGHGTTPVSLTTVSVVERLPTESTLVDLTLGSTREWHTITLQLIDSSWGFLAHIGYGILITEPIRSLDCVVGVPAPIIFSHVCEGSIDASLCGNSV
jgi:hypothetical protein